MCMSLNGMSEAYAYALADNAILNQLQALMVFNSCVYIAAVIVLSNQFGIVGLVFANCLNMSIRALCSLSITLKAREGPSLA